MVGIYVNRELMSSEIILDSYSNAGDGGISAGVFVQLYKRDQMYRRIKFQFQFIITVGINYSLLLII